jgi:hypothetical protein
MQKSNIPMILIRKVDYGIYLDLFDIKECNQLYLEVLYLISHHLIFPILQYDPVLYHYPAHVRHEVYLLVNKHALTVLII